MIGVKNMPACGAMFVIVIVLHFNSFGPSLPSRPRAARSLMLSAIIQMLRRSASLITGTISPLSVSVAIPDVVVLFVHNLVVRFVDHRVHSLGIDGKPQRAL